MWPATQVGGKARSSYGSYVDPGTWLLSLASDPSTFLGDGATVCRGPVFLESPQAWNRYLYCSVGLRKNLPFGLGTKNSLFSVGEDLLLAYLRLCPRPS